MQNLIRTLTALLLVLTLGLHWAMLQSVAWVGMIVTYSRDASLTEAINKTFDGQHPCKMCKVIKQARAEEKQKEQKQNVKPGSKSELGLVWQATPFDFSADFHRVLPTNSKAPTRSNEPPKPRPRAA